MHQLLTRSKTTPMLAMALLWSIFIVGCSRESEPPAPIKETISALNTNQEFMLYHGGDIVTMEEDQAQAEAVVTNKEGRIEFVGTREAATKAYPQAASFDLESKTLMPGFIEQHIHPFLGALTLSITVIAPEQWQLPDKTWPAVLGQENYLEALSAAEQAMGNDDEILWSWGFNQFFHGDINRQMLDTISATRPIAVWHRSAHEFYLNSAFIERFGISQSAIDATGPEAAAQADLARGHFYEAGALLYLLPIIFPELGTAERFQQGLSQMIAMLHRKGVTAFNEPGAFIPPNMIPLYQAVLGAETTPMYSFFIPETKTPFYIHGEAGVVQAVEQATTIFPSDGKMRFFDKQIKILFDGAIISQLMQMKDGYLDGHHGEWIQSPEEVEKIITLFWNAGYQIHIHVNGDLGLEQLITILQQRMIEHPREDHRTTIVHFANSTDEQIQQLKELGAIISANPYYVTGFGNKFGEIGLGPKRAHAMVRLGTVEKAGISVSLHSDMPMAPADPLFLAWSAATRDTNEGNTLRPDLALSRHAALRAITIDAAYSWRMEDSLGSIKPGKIANFTILQKNPYDVTLDKLKDIPVYATVFEGELFPVSQE